MIGRHLKAMLVAGTELDDAKFSVIIPTLQRSNRLVSLIQQCAAHPLVHEVIVINNAPTALSLENSKVRVLDQPANIYVNPAWNLGARESEASLLAIINDDVGFNDEALDHAAEILRKGRFNIVGPDSSCFLPHATKRPIEHRVASGLRFRYGTFMCMRKADYTHIPDELLIWGGDDWLFWNQRRPNAVLIHTPFATEMGTTTGSAEFQEFRQHEHEISSHLFDSIYGTRWWHRPVSALERFRLMRARIGHSLSHWRHR